MTERFYQLADTGGHFGPVFIVEPMTSHTHTAILLHGRGSNGEEFAQELFDETKLSNGTSLAQALPSWRWVFPSSPELWSTAFEEDMPAWFEAHSLTDTTARQDLQIPGIKDSVNYLKNVLEEEIEKLGGTTESVVLGGISQGAAVGMWTLLCRGHLERPLGAFFGTNTWLPFAYKMEHHLLPSHSIENHPHDSSTEQSQVDAFMDDMLASAKSSLAQDGETFLSTPIFLGHGVDDAYVDIDLGREARDVFTRIGVSVEWKEYTGAELEGHWIKSPEEVDDLLDFLVKHTHK
ncbi:Alpha/Beta hydrolase protein [Fusarium tricinctum]|uniref:Alpha/Beta hydrolase protein n=1 Tax=Fusarium tricinctum TaxID=61284 RepID=A0A8K0RS56_9HYPO|nr:Alpha/Beta hydrolase protein [Fusarium tricinctum]